MRTKLPTRIDVVRKEEKEAHLVTFIRADLEAARARASARPAPRTYLLVVRSLQSPVVLALQTLAAELADAAVDLRLIVVQPVLGADPAPGCDGATRLAPVLKSARVLRDIRFLDAHEQLRLDDKTIWFGDCMRREPGKRDAYECFAADNPELAHWAETSFERLWALGQPIAFAAAPAAAEPSPLEAAQVCAAALLPSDAVSTVEVATRH